MAEVDEVFTGEEEEEVVDAVDATDGVPVFFYLVREFEGVGGVFADAPEELGLGFSLDGRGGPSRGCRGARGSGGRGGR